MDTSFIPYLQTNCNRVFRLFLLGALIPADGHFERGLSLALDRALAAWEGGGGC
jgi:hypothetical protein